MPDRDCPVARRMMRIFMSAGLIAGLFAARPALAGDEVPDGVWLSRGYGILVDSSADGMAVYQYDPPVGCLLVERTGPAVPARNSALEVTKIATESERTLRVHRRGAAGYLVFDRIVEKPALCDKPVPRDPVTVLNHFCHAFQSHYAFFAERRVDWDAACAQARQTITPASSDQVLFQTLSGLIDKLNDRHVMLMDGRRMHYSGLGPILAPLFERYSKDQRKEKFRAFVDAELAAYKDTTLRHNIATAVNTGANGRLIWGKGKSEIGYIWISGFTDYGPTADSPYEAQMQELRATLDRILQDLKDAPAIVIDLRLSGGGTDLAVLELAGRFSSRPWLAFSKQARSSGGLTDPQWFHVQPTGPMQYDGPVALLVSNFSVSAAENFGMEMMTRPHPVVIVGEPTASVHSDVLPWRLPNGWTVTISNEIFRSSNGTVYETRGLSPAVTVPYFTPATLRDDKDRAVEAALKLLGIKPD